MAFRELQDAFIHPDPNQKIWRYLDLPKFASLVQGRAIYFARASLFEDRFEGMPSQALARAMNGAKNVFAPFRGMAVPDPHPDHYYFLAEGYAQAVRWREAIYVSCWSGDDNENLALWRLYCGGSRGVAIRTTWQKLVSALESTDQHEFEGGWVQYADADSHYLPPGNVCSGASWKRPQFGFEREVRFVFVDFRSLVTKEAPNTIDWSLETPKGHQIPIDVNATFDEVVLSPGSPPWFEDEVRRLLDRCSVSVPVRRSSHEADPAGIEEMRARSAELDRLMSDGPNK